MITDAQAAEMRAEIEAGEAALDVARQAVAARERFGWSPEADAAIGRLREMLGTP